MRLRHVFIDLAAVKRLAGFVARRLGEDRVAQVAGSLTFTSVLSVVPLATVAFALFTAFPIFGSFQSSLQDFLAAHLMPTQINTQIFNYLNQFAAKAKGLTTVGLIILFVTSVMTMMTIESALNVIWRVKKARPFAQRVMVYWAIITLGPILFGCSLSISSYVFAHSIAFAGSHNLMPPIVEWALTGVSLPLTVFAFTIIYVFMPNCKVEWRDAVIGGLIAAVAFELGKRGFGYYVRRIPTYTAVYGAFAALPVFLLWVYLCWMIALVGAMVTSALPAIRIGQYHRRDFPGSDLLYALEILARLVELRDEGKPGYTAMELAKMARCDLDTSTRLITRLDALGWIGRLEDSKMPRFVLIANPAHITMTMLFDQFVIDREELDYQLRLDATHLDRTALMEALENDRLEATLNSLVAARAAALTNPRLLETPRSSMPQQPA
ncbi:MULTISPECIES: YihY family inner membrane protein [unclassified Caballeronia]|jgi:membrane protein|uniref:YihY family inner membrane protein n=1 Tax=Caballeronia sp. GAWG1-1 TaxID=2921742 RepID=UPI002027BA73|nr:MULTISPECIES: YihY family inner membrane protein [unclassified Caballeronia]MDR5771277.1 YihY family inner membrane protein [Caballeronia sp. LZ002]MDR5846713.1 YihY family inner membrane protein [Caballeronia sp. LZ003]